MNKLERCGPYNPIIKYTSRCNTCGNPVEMCDCWDDEDSEED